MPNPHPNLSGLQRHTAAQIKAKAQRLAAGKPKWKDEQYMNADEYEAYVDRYLHHVPDDEAPGLDEAKLAKDMLALKKKYDSGVTNPLLDES